MALERKKDFRESDFEVNKNSKKICFQIFFFNFMLYSLVCCCHSKVHLRVDTAK